MLKRTVEWGHWGITFSEHEVDENGRRSYAPTKIYGTVAFPVGTRGPIDQPRKKEYLEMIRIWTNNGPLPLEAI